MDKKKDRIIKELSLFKKRYEKKYKIKKMIIFGSLAKGRFTKDSDIDIIIVSESFKNKKSYKRSPSLYLDWTLKYPVDFLCYTPEEFEKRKKYSGLIHDVVREGIEI